MPTKTKIPEEWKKMKIQNTAPLQRGFDLPISKIKTGKYPVVFSNGILKTHDEYKAKAPGVVTGRSGTIGKVTFVTEDYWPHNTSLWVTDFKGNFPKYIYYFYLHFDLTRFSSGSGVPTLNRNDIHSQTILLPPLPEQTRIVQILETWDKAIEKLKRKIEIKKNIKKSLMQKLLTGKVRLKGFSGGEWETFEFSDCFFVLNKQEGEKKSNYLEKGNFPIIDQSQSKIAGYSNNEKIIISKNLPLIIFGDHTRVLKLIDRPFVLGNDGTKVFYGKNNFDTKYLFYYLNIIPIPNTGYNRHFKYLKDLVIYIPSVKEEQSAIAQILTTSDNEIEALQKKLSLLEQQKKYLLNNLITGKIRTPENLKV